MEGEYQGRREEAFAKLEEGKIEFNTYFRNLEYEIKLILEGDNDRTLRRLLDNYPRPFHMFTERYRSLCEDSKNKLQEIYMLLDEIKGSIDNGSIDPQFLVNTVSKLSRFRSEIFGFKFKGERARTY